MKYLIVLVVAIIVCLVATNNYVGTEKNTSEVAIMFAEEGVIMLVANEEAVVSSSIIREGSAVASDIEVASANPMAANKESAVAILSLERIGRAAPGDSLVAVTNGSFRRRVLANESASCVLKLPIVNMVIC